MKFDIEKLTAEDILKFECPMDFFGYDNIKEVQKKYNSLWHPDRNPHPLAAQVMAHVNVLTDRAERGDWGKMFTFSNTATGRMFKFRYTKSTKIDIGTMYMGKRRVVFNASKENMDLMQLGLDSILSIVYPTKILEQNFKRFVPSDVGYDESTDNGYVLLMYKGPDQICLADLIKSGFKIEPNHLTWIVSGLYNFCLFMHQTQHKMFGGLGLESIYINPIMRGVHILGGWWYATPLEKPLLALPEWLVSFLPASVLSSKTASPIIDQIAIKAIAIRLLGDPTGVGSKLHILDKKYQPLINFLRAPCQSSLIKDYSSWLKVESKLASESIPVTFDTLYKEE
jgi:hypothetical protein